MRSLAIDYETFDLHKPFSTATGTIDCLTVLTATIREGDYTGRGECVPSAAQMVKREEGVQIAESIRDQILYVQNEIESGISSLELLEVLPRGPARNAVDCALWDLQAKIKGIKVSSLLGINSPGSLVTASTVSINTPELMHQYALELQDAKLIKVKLGGHEDEAAISAVRSALPNSELIVDINGAWKVEDVEEMSAVLKKYDVKLLEQPVSAGSDSGLENINSSIPLCADESCHDRSDLDWVDGRYQYVNIKLDKSGGLTEALELAYKARERGMGVMVGCMAGTSLSMAPAALVGTLCDFVDLDGPLILSKDRDHGLRYKNSKLYYENSELWG